MNIDPPRDSVIDQTKIKVFLSRCLEDSVDSFADAIYNFLYSNFGIPQENVITIGKHSTKDKNIFDDVKDSIPKCNFTICVFSRYVSIGNEQWISKPAVYMEYTISKLCHKEIIPLFESGVVIDTLIDKSTQYLSLEIEVDDDNTKYGYKLVDRDNFIKNSIEELIKNNFKKAVSSNGIPPLNIIQSNPIKR